MTAKFTVEELAIKGKRVFLRVDFNVHIQNGRVIDGFRIEQALPTINKILSEGGILLLASHRGRPGGEPQGELSLRPVATELERRLHREILLAPTPVGAETRRMARALQPGNVLLLENLRFHPGENANEKEFAQELASYADLYVNDAFGTAHRAHASTVGVPHFFSTPAAGYLINEELQVLSRARSQPDRPLALLLGGAKVSDKMALLQHMLDKIDILLLGGAMAYVFGVLQGQSIGDSFMEAGQEELAHSILDAVRSRSDLTFILPSDHVIQRSDATGEEHRITEGVDIPPGWRGVDIGPQTIKEFQHALERANMVIWNGPLGIFEQPPFEHGTKAVAETIAALSCESIIGGGETSTILRLLKHENHVSHISTGGGACLTFLSGKPLPAIEVLKDRATEDYLPQSA